MSATDRHTRLARAGHQLTRRTVFGEAAQMSRHTEVVRGWLAPNTIRHGEPTYVWDSDGIYDEMRPVVIVPADHYDSLISRDEVRKAMEAVCGGNGAGHPLTTAMDHILALLAIEETPQDG